VAFGIPSSLAMPLSEALLSAGLPQKGASIRLVLDLERTCYDGTAVIAMALACGLSCS
jgi:hypothetical protein